MPPTNTPQTSLYETTIEHDDLEKILDKRADARDKKREATQAFKKLDDQAKALIDSLELGVGAPVRVGDWLITVSEVKGRAVAFETEATTRLGISPIPGTENA